MENNYLKTRFASVFERERKMWTQILILGFLMLFAHLSTYAQPCNPDLAMTITTYDASAETVSDAKIRISGIQNGNYKVGLSTGATYAGPAFAALGVYSSLTNGFVSETLAAPSAAPGTQYTVRVFNETGSCFTDSTFYLPYVNYNYAPTYVDLEATITRSPAGDVPLGSQVTLTVAVRNSGSLDATGVVYQIGSAVDLAFDTHSTTDGAYVPGTGVWTIGNINAGQTVSLTLTYTVNARGIKEITAEATALNEIDLDSTPTANPEVEDDEAQICITTHRDYCNGDEYTFALVNGDYTGVVWQRSTDNGTTWTTITGNTPNYEVTATGQLIIKSVGDYKYYRDATPTSCGYEGCCPIKVIPGLPPILTKPSDEVICFGQPAPLIQSTNTQTGYTATDHTTYGISSPITGFLADQGVFNYQWFNNNGPSNPTTDSLSGNNTLTLATLPTATGIYNYRLISQQNGHISCTDTTEVQFIINETPVAFASSNTPICAEDTIKLFGRNDAVNGTINPFPATSFEWWGPDGFTSNAANDTILVATEAMEGNYFLRAFHNSNGRVCSDTVSIPVVINPLPDRPLAIDTSYCQQISPERLSAILRNPVADHVGTSLNWYHSSGITDVYDIDDIPDTTTVIGYNVGPFANTTISAGQDIWWVSTTDGLGCQSHIDTLVITIREKPTVPIVRDIAFCENFPATPLTATTTQSGYGLIWYGEDKMVIPGDTGATFTAPRTNDTVGVFTYWVSQYDLTTNCQSDTIDFDVFVKDTPVGPSVVEPTYCLDVTNSTAVPLQATPIITNTVTNVPNTLTWYWNGGTQPTAPTPTTDLPGATWAYVTQTVLYDTLSCESPQSPLKITVNPLPVAGVIPVSALCIGTISQNNGQLILTRFRDSEQAAYNIGSTFTAPGTFNVIPANGEIVPAPGLPNPATAQQDYTVRIKNFHPGPLGPTQFECFLDVTVPLIAKDCTCPGGYCEPATVTKTK
ncbi:MAG TPA: DUF11 domain-containing protein [Leadbetterella sp.]|nr:DUF11 domain-containing protein [Leadbetterella sp.]